VLPPNTTTFAVQYSERRSRLTTFFRLLLVLPHLIVLWAYSLVAALAVFVAWFAIVFTARYPQGLYDFVAGFHRYYARVMGYYNLLADPYPPFSGRVDPEYPVRLEIGPPMEKYNRLLTFFRIVLLIPVWIIAYVLGIVAGAMVLLAWLVIVILGRMPEGLQRIIEYCYSYLLRAGVYASLLTEAFPPFDGSPDAVGSAAASGPGTPDGPVAAGTVAPATADGIDGIGDPPR
jgi:hypothetical protein